MYRPVLSIFLSTLVIISVTALPKQYDIKQVNNDVQESKGYVELGDDNSNLIPNKDANAESTTYSDEMWKKLHPDIKWNSKHANNVPVGGWGDHGVYGVHNSNLIPNKDANAEYLSTGTTHAESTTYSDEMWKKLHPDIKWNRKNANNVPVGGWGGHGVYGVHSPIKDAIAEYLSTETTHAESTTYSDAMWKKLHPEDDIKWNVGSDYRMHNLTVGYKTYQDRLIYSGAITQPYRFFRIVETDVVIRSPYGVIISFIEANATNSRANNAGYASIKAGGIGRRNVTLHLESARNYDLKYFVRVYGH